MPNKPNVFRPNWMPDTSTKGGNQGRTEANREIYGSQRWRKLSAAHKKQNPLCVECEKRGHVVPVEVTDHITPINQGGDPWDWDNLQSLCKSDHNRKSGAERHGKYYARREKGTHTQIIILYGPPASGKTSWVEDNREEGDLILDLDTIWQAITGLPMYEKPNQLTPVIFAIRDAILDTIPKMPGLKRALIITTNMRTPAMIAFMNRHRCEVIELEADEQTCIDRIMEDYTRVNKQHHIKLVQEWFEINKRDADKPNFIW